MADMNKRGASDCDDCDDCESGERGERGKRGHRGHRGHDGHDGHDGTTGPTGPTGSSATGPTGPAGATGPASSGTPIIAAALVNGQPAGDGFVSNKGFASYVRTGPGQWQLALAGTPPPDANCIVNVTLDTLLSNEVNVVAGVVVGVVGIFIYTPTGTVFRDARFYVTVTDNR